ARGIVPIGYALFGFALGVTLGMLIRRTIPAMAATLAIYGAAVFRFRSGSGNTWYPPATPPNHWTLRHWTS
ncbi:MAG TPA: hypothetical protein VK585_17605, partial [Jiangellaceae bacterium]|nr:hypothetical protein [Jiangellaceae bacterium]